MRPMLRSLLADRFKLTIRHETKDLPVYELAVASGGPKIALAKDGSCVVRDPNGPRLPLGSKPCGGVLTRLGGIEGFGVTMPKLVELLAERVGCTVIDKTGFIGAFNFRLDFTPDEALGDGSGPAMLGDPGTQARSASLSGPSIFTALHEQLGLQLRSAKGPLVRRAGD
jgi:uncharacterized protein (TIGR03435 family)